MSDQACSGWRRLEERAEKAEAERDRYREALKQIASHDQPLDFDDMGCARAALSEQEGEG